MNQQKSNGVRFILLGMIVAFLFSALSIPITFPEVKDSQDKNLALNQSGNSRSSQHAPISLPGEEKEEENRVEKDSKFTLAIIDSSIEYSLSLQVESICFRLDQTYASLSADIPLYLLKNSFLI